MAGRGHAASAGLPVVLPHATATAGDRHDHGCEDSTAQAEPARAGAGPGQCAEGMPDRRLQPAAVLRDPSQLPDLRCGGPGRQGQGAEGAASESAGRRDRAGDPRPCPGTPYPRADTGGSGSGPQRHAGQCRRGARRLEPARSAHQARAAAAAEEGHGRAYDRAHAGTGETAGAVQPGVPRAAHRGAACRRFGRGRHLLRRCPEGRGQGLPADGDRLPLTLQPAEFS